MSDVWEAPRSRLVGVIVQVTLELEATAPIPTVPANPLIEVTVIVEVAVVVARRVTDVGFADME